MAEPMSSTEIEDVLSSIRRLVSEDMRPGSKPQPKSDAATPEAATPVALKTLTVKNVVINSAAPPEAADKLILTPALRVIEAAATAAPTAPMFIATPRRNLALDAAAPPAIEAVVASLGAAVDASDEDWEDDLPEAAYDEAGYDKAQDWSFAEADESLDEIYSPELEAEAANAETPNADAAYAEPPVPGWAQTETEAEGLETPQASHPAAEAAGMAFEPDPLWVAAAEASVIAALAADALDADAQASENASDDPYDDAALRFNEDVLRELVRDMLREELAGTLGERITRNIRKLVRAEIARSLAAQDFS